MILDYIIGFIIVWSPIMAFFNLINFVLLILILKRMKHIKKE